LSCLLLAPAMGGCQSGEGEERLGGSMNKDDPRAVLRDIIAPYPKADRDKLLRIFRATVIESRSLEREVIAEMATS
jgi:hypothetical protein